MSVINTNVKALVAQNSLNVNNRTMSKTMEQLSTGKRINGAADDAAGLAISTKMTSQIRGLNQAVRNANDGISLIQTAEGALNEITNMLQRMRQLAVQSANDTNTGSDREALNAEFGQLRDEINRIGNNTQFNGMNILDQSFDDDSGTFSFQVGANASQTIKIDIGNFRTLNPTEATAEVSVKTAGSAAVAADVDAGISAADAVAREVELTFGGTLKAGEVISLKVGAGDFTYTVLEDDTPSTVATAVAALTMPNGITAAASAGKVTFTQDAGTGFEVTSSIAGAGPAPGLAMINEGNIEDRAGADSAIVSIDSALAFVSEGRANMGAIINRLNYAADNLANVSMNASASRSRIEDTDYAQATTDLARSQIIQQAATAMLAQANQQPAAVLSLLQ